MQKILVVFGTRPEAIKMAPVLKALSKRPQDFEVKVCVTAQHRAILDQVLDTFGVKAHYDLNIMEERQSLGQITANVLIRLEPVIQHEAPNWLLVQGDTTTTMAATLAAFYQKVKVAHIEAGLRTWDRFQPYPEEINRKIVDAVCDLHFAPTETARQNLLREGVQPDCIKVTGNTVIDSLLYALEQPFTPDHTNFKRIPLDKKVILVTAHRRENFGIPLENICRALLTIASTYPSEIHVVFLVHPNPNVRETVYQILSSTSNISLIEPLDYLSFVNLMKLSYLVLTDSGGLQEEAPSLGKPVLVLREISERPEAVDAGTVRVVGTDQRVIVEQTIRLLEDASAYQRMAIATNPYGDGKASARIVSALCGYHEMG